LDRNKQIENLPADVKDLFALLQKLKKHFDDNFISELNRSLPFADLLFDRWERAKLAGFGEGTSVYDSCCIFGKVKVGVNTWIGPFTVLDGSGGLDIGDNCSISAGVQIYSHDSVQWAISGGKEKYEYDRTSIGSNCYIGPNTIITKGVTLGNNLIVGANSFVKNSFPEGSKIAGSPARLIK
jgi:acetyltransferase-like isoleucine patch superfamily enzyme